MTNILNSDSVKEFERLIKSSTNIVLSCHVRPDGDAIGSTLGLYHLLKRMGKNATVVVPDQPPRTLHFLPGVNEIAIFTKHDSFCRQVIEDADLIICCDFNTFSRQSHLGPIVEQARCKKVLIDHHLEPDMDVDVMFSFSEMSSTCELVCRVIAAAGYFSMLDQKGAECLLAGIETDTKNFRVNCENPELFEVVMHLMEKGVNRLKIAKQAVFTSSYSSIRLKSYALVEKLEIYPEHRCAIITLTQDELNRFNYEKGDTEGLVDTPLEIRGVLYSIFMREDNDCIKISARSCDEFPVSEICKHLYNGGGHVMAAGGEFYGTLDEAHRLLIDNMKKYDRYIPAHYPGIQLD